jgi:tetratricopeptide (TPR) repeat protein
MGRAVERELGEAGWPKGFLHCDRAGILFGSEMRFRQIAFVAVVGSFVSSQVLCAQTNAPAAAPAAAPSGKAPTGTNTTIPLTLQAMPATKYSSDPKEAAKQRLYEAVQLMYNSNYADALKDVDAVLKSDPGNLLAYTLRAEIHSRQQQWPEAHQDLAAALKLAPNNAVLMLTDADIDLRQGLFEQARAKYLQIPASGGSVDMLKYRILLCDVGAKKSAEAQKDITAFTDPKSLGYLFGHAILALQKGDTAAVRENIGAAGTGGYPKQVLVSYLAGIEWIGLMPALKAALHAPAQAAAPSGMAPSGLAPAPSGN